MHDVERLSQEIGRTSLDLPITEKGETALILAAYTPYGNSRVCAWLIHAGSNINAMDNEGNTALNLALYHAVPV